MIEEIYLDMLILQAELNEEKLGASADSVAYKLERIKQEILENAEIVNSLSEIVPDIDDGDWDGIIEFIHKYRKLLESIRENKK